MKNLENNWGDRLGSLVSHMIISLQGFILIPIIIKNSGEADFGLFTLVSGFVSLFLGISPIGTNIHLRRNLVKEQTQKERSLAVFNIIFLQLSIVSICFVSLLLLIAIFEWKPFLHITLVLVVFAILIPYVIFNNFSDVLRYTGNISLYNRVTASFPIFLSIFSLIYVLLMPAPNVVGFLICQVSALILCLLVWYAKISKLLTPVLTFYRSADFKKHALYGLPLTAAFVSEFLFGVADRYLIGGKLGLGAVGMYAAAFSVGGIIFVVPKVLNVIALPRALKKNEIGDSIGSEEITAQCLLLMVLAFVPFMIGSFLYGWEVLAFLSNQATATAAHHVVTIIAFSFFFQGLILICSQFYFVDNKIMSTLQIYLIGASTNIFLNIIVLNLFSGLVWPALASLLSAALCAVLALRRLSKRQLALLYHYAKFGIVRGVLPSMALFGCAMFFELLSVYGLFDKNKWFIFNIFICGAVYVACLLASQETRRILRGL